MIEYANGCYVLEEDDTCVVDGLIITPQVAIIDTGNKSIVLKDSTIIYPRLLTVINNNENIILSWKTSTLA